jgi:tRNA A37 threonylcarbamoyladenosine dehydratase
MTNNDYSERFAGIQRLYGHTKAQIIPTLHIVVIGIGGVGSWAAEALARSGVGKITLIDHDDISLSNINRQIHTLESTLEQSKVLTMQARILQINPYCHCHAIDDMLTTTTINHYFDKNKPTPFDYVIDAIDSVQHKSALIYHCKRNKIPIITTGGAGGLIDPTAIEIKDLSKTYNDPLAAKVRSELRSHYHFTRNPQSRFGIECVFSIEQQQYPQKDGTMGQQKPKIKGLSLDCNFGYGSSSCVTSVFGFAAAARAIEKSLLRRQAIHHN